jgi:hypothetical protein
MIEKEGLMVMDADWHLLLDSPMCREVVEVAPLPVLQWAPELDKGSWEGKCAPQVPKWLSAWTDREMM